MHITNPTYTHHHPNIYTFPPTPPHLVAKVDCTLPECESRLKHVTTCVCLCLCVQLCVCVDGMCLGVLAMQTLRICTHFHALVNAIHVLHICTHHTPHTHTHTTHTHTYHTHTHHKYTHTTHTYTHTYKHTQIKLPYFTKHINPNTTHTPGAPQFFSVVSLNIFCNRLIFAVPPTDGGVAANKYINAKLTMLPTC